VHQIKKIFILCLAFRRKWFFCSCSVNVNSVSNILCKQSFLFNIFWRKYQTVFMQNIPQTFFDKFFFHLHFMVLSIKFIHNLLLIFWQVFFFWLIYITEKNIEAHVKNGKTQNFLPIWKNFHYFQCGKNIPSKYEFSLPLISVFNFMWMRWKNVEIKL